MEEKLVYYRLYTLHNFKVSSTSKHHLREKKLSVEKCKQRISTSQPDDKIQQVTGAEQTSLIVLVSNQPA